MPAPLYGADDPRNCSGSSKAEVLENIKNIFDTFIDLPPETKAERMYRRDIQLALKDEKDRTNETSIRPFRKACVITAHAMALSVMTEEFTMRGLAYNPGILPAEMIIRQRVKPMPSREELLKRKSFGSVNDNKYLNAMWRSGKK